MASDHGFGPTSDVFYLNTWLDREGYLGWAATGTPAGRTKPTGSGSAGSPATSSSWTGTRTLAYAATPSSQGIHIVRGAAGDGGLDPASPFREDAVRDELAEALRCLRHPVTGRRVVSEVWTREEGVSPGQFEALGPRPDDHAGGERDRLDPPV